MRASALRPSSQNWRTHPENQRSALQGLLAEIGYAVPVIARETAPGGPLEVIDGHLRVETMGDEEVPVVILDVTEAEAAKLLATVDPLSALAGQDDTKLIELLQGVSSDTAAVQAMLAGLVKLPEEGGEAAQFDLPPPSYDVLVTCADEREQVELLERLTSEGLTCRSMIT